MKIKLTNLLVEGVISVTPPNSFGSPSSSYKTANQQKQTFNPKQPFGQPIIPSLPRSSGVSTTTLPKIPTTTTSKSTKGSFILDNPPTDLSAPTQPYVGEPPAILRPNFNPIQPFGQPVIPTVPLAPPGAEYSPTPGSVKPKTPTTVQVPPAPAPAPAPAPTPAPTPAPAPTPDQTSNKQKPKTQEEVNREDTEKRHQQLLAFQQRKAERDKAIAAAREAEAERREAENEVERQKRGGRGVYEQYKLQFKPNALKTLLQEDGVIDTSLNYLKNVWNKGFVPTTKKAIEDTIGTEYFTKGAIHPNIAAREYIKMTKEVPGEPTTNFLKSVFRYSPQTLARMQAGRYARAAAFDPEEAQEKIGHYAKMAAITNPLYYTGALTSRLGSAISAAGSVVKHPMGKAALGLAGLGVGLAGAAGKLADPILAQQAKETGKLVAARKDDWRYATI